MPAKARLTHVGMHGVPGRGTPVKDGINLTWTGFRPSDDLAEFGQPIANCESKWRVSNT